MATTDADPTGEWYCFERGAKKDSGGDGWADVWKRGCFAWEYKGKRANLDAAFNQLRQYALALENPPLLIVSDMDRFRIRTNWTNTVSKTHEFTLDDLADGTWLNPPELVDGVAEPVPNYPARPVPRDDAAAEELKARTLTRLYNARPQWLADAHAALDAAVAAAYGWDAEISEDEALRRLLNLNEGLSRRETVADP